jgi:pyruvate-ferredoxin/flavodoxin oxidoreductase
MPRLYSGCYGLGSRDLQPEALIGAVENMLPDGAQRSSSTSRSTSCAIR